MFLFVKVGLPTVKHMMYCFMPTISWQLGNMFKAIVNWHHGAIVEAVFSWLLVAMMLPWQVMSTSAVDSKRTQPLKLDGG